MSYPKQPCKLARTAGFFRSKGRETIAWPMKTFIGRCDVWNASSGVVVPYMEIYVWSFYFSFIVHLPGTIKLFRIAVVTCMAGDALAFSCGMAECECCADWIWEHGLRLSAKTHCSIQAG